MMHARSPSFWVARGHASTSRPWFVRRSPIWCGGSQLMAAKMPGLSGIVLKVGRRIYGPPSFHPLKMP